MNAAAPVPRQLKFFEAIREAQDRISLQQGIDETIAWVDRWLDDLKQHPFDYVHKL